MKDERRQQVPAARDAETDVLYLAPERSKRGMTPRFIFTPWNFLSSSFTRRQNVQTTHC